MSLIQPSSSSREIDAVTEWWREAGVDSSFEDKPTVWLAQKEVEEKPKPASAKAEQPENSTKNEPPTVFGGGAEAWPSELPSFQTWLAGDLAQEIAGRTGVQPSGSSGSGLMVIVPEPEKTDRDQLLSGPTGEYLRTILNASQISEAEVYLASALPVAMPHPDWQELNSRGLGQLLHHHIRLVAPKGIVALGSSILPLIGNNPAQGPAEIQHFEQDSAPFPLFAAWQLERLRQRSAARKRFWKLWLDWIASND